jgi:hypothetical protein
MMRMTESEWAADWSAEPWAHVAETHSAVVFFTGDRACKLKKPVSRSEPSRYSVTVKDGVVTLEGSPETVAIGHDLLRRARHVEGVVAVRDRLAYPVPPVPSTPGPYF